MPNDELEAWLKGDSVSQVTATAPVSGETGGDELGAWLSGTSTPSASTLAQAPVTAPAKPASTPMSWGAKLLDLLNRPGNAVRTGMKYTNTDTIGFLWDPGFWHGVKLGITGQEEHSGNDLLKEWLPQEATAAHPTLTKVAGMATDLLTDPLVVGPGAGEAAAKAFGPLIKTFAGVATGLPEGVRAVETMVGPLMDLAKTSKAALAARAVGRSVAGMFSLDAALSHLPKGRETAQAIREFLGGKSLGQAENEKRVTKIFDGLANATPEEKQTLAYILDSPTAAEAQAGGAREAERTAAAARKVADLGWQRPAPWDTPAPYADQTQRIAERLGAKPAAMAQPEWEQLQSLARAADDELSSWTDRLAQGARDPEALSEARQMAAGQLRGDANSALAKYEAAAAAAENSVQTPGAFGAAVLDKSASGATAFPGLAPNADPFRMPPAGMESEYVQQLDQVQRELAGYRGSIERNAQSLAEQMAKEQTAQNDSLRRSLWKSIQQHGKIAPYAGGYLTEDLYKAIPSHLKDVRRGVPLDQLASALGYDSDEALAKEIARFRDMGPVNPADVYQQALESFKGTSQGQEYLSKVAANEQAEKLIQEQLDQLRAQISSGRLSAGELDAARAEEAYLEAERAGMGEGAGSATEEAVQGAQTASAYPGVPENLRHLVQPVMEKYGSLIPEFRTLTDEAYARAKGFLPNLGYQEFYYPRISRAGSESDNALTKLYHRLTTDDQAVLTRKDQLAGALSGKPGFSKQRTLDTLADYAEYAGAKGRHAVLDPGDALLQHLDQATHAEQSLALRDKLLSMGEEVASKEKRVPLGFMDMAHIPGWEGVSVQKDIGRVLQDVLLPKQRGAAGVLYDKMASGIKSATFYNPLVHGKNLAYRAAMEGQNPLGAFSSEIMDEVQNLGPTLKKLIQYGGATEYRPLGEEAARDLYREVRLAGGTAPAREKVTAALEWAHESLWQYDKALRVAMANDLEAQGVAWPDIVKQVNAAYSKPLDPTFANMWLKRLLFTPAWTFNNLAWDVKNALNPRVRAFIDILDGINESNTGHGREGNPNHKEEYTALSQPGPDGKQFFLNVNTPDKDLREVARNPLDFLWQRLAPIPQTAGGIVLGNSRPLDPERGLDYNKPGAGGPLIGYGANGQGPEVDLRTQAAMRLFPQMLGFPLGSIVGEGANAARSDNPGRDALLRLGGMYATDMNDRLESAKDRKDALTKQRQAIRARAIRKYRQEHPQK